MSANTCNGRCNPPCLKHPRSAEELLRLTREIVAKVPPRHDLNPNPCRAALEEIRTLLQMEQDEVCDWEQCQRRLSEPPPPGCGSPYRHKQPASP